MKPLTHGSSSKSSKLYGRKSLNSTIPYSDLTFSPVELKACLTTATFKNTAVPMRKGLLHGTSSQSNFPLVFQRHRLSVGVPSKSKRAFLQARSQRPSLRSPPRLGTTRPRTPHCTTSTIIGGMHHPLRGYRRTTSILVPPSHRARPRWREGRAVAHSNP